jgi:hypothetical protein
VFNWDDADRVVERSDGAAGGSSAFADDVARRKAAIEANKPAWLRNWEQAPRLYAGSAPDNNPAQAADAFLSAALSSNLLASSAPPDYSSPYEPVAANDGQTQIVRRQPAATQASGTPLPPVENLYTPLRGLFSTRYHQAIVGMVDPNSSWGDRLVYGALAAGTALPAAVDMMGEALFNAPNAAGRGGQWLARGNLATDNDTRVISYLAATSEFANAFVGLAGPLAGVGAPQSSLITAEQRAVQGFAGAEWNSLVRATYGESLRFDTNGVRFSSSLLDSNAAVRNMYNEFLASTRGDVDLARRFTAQAVESGQALPAMRLAAPDEQFLRLTPVMDGGIGRGSYFMSRSTYDSLLGRGLDANAIAKELGLPLTSSMRARFSGFDVYSVTPNPGSLATVYESQTASVMNGPWRAPGGAWQVIIPNRANFTVRPDPMYRIPASGPR